MISLLPLTPRTLRFLRKIGSWLRGKRNIERPPALPVDSAALATDMPSEIIPSSGGGIWVRTMDKQIEMLSMIDMLPKKGLTPGSMIEIYTTNSVYELYVLEGDDFIVSGGWFDKQNLSPYHVCINGCTWGGSAIKHDIIAGEMMHIEFNTGDRNIVTTSSIKSWKVYEASRPNF